MRRRSTSGCGSPPRVLSRIPRGALALSCVSVVTACGPSDGLERVALRMTAAETGRPFEIPSFTLTDQTAEQVDVADVVDGRFTLLFFGYTHCPDVCPISMASANAAVRLLSPDERARTRLLFVTVDPRRDSSERITEWLSALGAPEAVGLRGSSTELTAFQEAMGFRVPPTTSWQPLPGAMGDAYLVPHPTALFLVTPDRLSRFQYGFDRATPTEIAEDLRRLMALEW